MPVRNEEPCRNQVATLDGTRAVVMLALLDKTVAILLGDDRVLVPFHRLEVANAQSTEDAASTGKL